MSWLVVGLRKSRVQYVGTTVLSPILKLKSRTSASPSHTFRAISGTLHFHFNWHEKRLEMKGTALRVAWDEDRLIDLHLSRRSLLPFRVYRQQKSQFNTSNSAFK